MCDCCNKIIVQNEIGIPGAQGAQGIQGIQGPIGPTGPTGPAGANNSILGSTLFINGDPNSGGHFNSAVYPLSLIGNQLSSNGQEAEFVYYGKHVASLSSGRLSIALRVGGSNVFSPILLSSTIDSFITAKYTIKRVSTNSHLIMYEFYKDNNLMTSGSLITARNITTSSFDSTLTTTLDVQLISSTAPGVNAGELLTYAVTLYLRN
jgi:hypothetical protein